jgi:hypothetical protein
MAEGRRRLAIRLQHARGDLLAGIQKVGGDGNRITGAPLLSQGGSHYAQHNLQARDQDGAAASGHTAAAEAGTLTLT